MQLHLPKKQAHNQVNDQNWKMSEAERVILSGKGDKGNIYMKNLQ